MREEVAADVLRQRYRRIFLPAIASGEWKRVLFVPTGALMSTGQLQ